MPSYELDQYEQARDEADRVARNVQAGLRLWYREKALDAVSFEYRVKSMGRIRDKLRDRAAREDPNGVNDFVGLRIVVMHSAFVPDAVDGVRTWAASAGFGVVQQQDYFAAHGSFGYRAFHVDLAPRSSEMQSSLMTIEVQVHTLAFRVLAEHTHRYWRELSSGRTVTPDQSWLKLLETRALELDAAAQRQRPSG